jgi:hypothetical protein
VRSTGRVPGFVPRASHDLEIGSAAAGDTALGGSRVGRTQIARTLDGVDSVRLRELGDGLGLLGGLQGEPDLEGGRMGLAWTGHDAPRDGAANFDEYNIPSCPVSGVHLCTRPADMRKSFDALWAYFSSCT